METDTPQNKLAGSRQNVHRVNHVSFYRPLLLFEEIFHNISIPGINNRMRNKDKHKIGTFCTE